MLINSKWLRRGLFSFSQRHPLLSCQLTCTTGIISTTLELAFASHVHSYSEDISQVEARGDINIKSLDGDFITEHEQAVLVSALRVISVSLAAAVPLQIAIFTDMYMST